MSKNIQQKQTTMVEGSDRQEAGVEESNTTEAIPAARNRVENDCLSLSFPLCLSSCLR